MVPARWGRDSSIATRRRSGARETRGRGRGRVRPSEATRVDRARRFGCLFRVGLVYFAVKYVPVFVTVRLVWKIASSVLQNCVRAPPRPGVLVFFLFLFIVRLIDDDAVIVFVLERPRIFRRLSTGIEEFLSEREPSGPREFEIVVVTETFPVRLTLCIEGFFE